jgi:hypothetical protein
MARSSSEVTSQEVQNYIQWCADHDIKNEDGTPDGNHNAQIVATCILEPWGVEFTRENLDKALPQLRSQLKFYTPLEAECHKLSAGMSQQDRNLILHMVSSRGLKDSGDDQLTNFATIASYLLDQRLPITPDNVDIALGRITNGGRRPLLWKKRLQPSEKEAQANREAMKNIQQQKNEDEVKILAGQNPALHEWYRQTHKKEQSATPEPTKSHYETLARAAAASVQSNVDRAEAERLLTRARAWGWELVYRSIESFI